MSLAWQQSALRGELRHDEPMFRHTSWRVGGLARHYYRPADALDLSNFLRSRDAAEPLLWLGLGSNLLVRDGGFPGTVIATVGRLDKIEVCAGNRLRVGAGASCAVVARRAARAGLCGCAFLAGIPGTMGGALATNAGAFGGETWEQVLRVQTIALDGQIQDRYPADFAVVYRSVSGPKQEWFLSCELQLRQGDAITEQAAISDLLAKRGRSQPIGKPSAGSTFRNPPGDHAARLIEAAGLKGFCIGGAEVSPMHANFIINTGTATARDVEDLIGHIGERVHRHCGVELQPEVHIVGVPA